MRASTSSARTGWDSLLAIWRRFGRIVYEHTLCAANSVMSGREKRDCRASFHYARNDSYFLSSRGSVVCDRGDLFFIILNSIQDLIFFVTIHVLRSFDKLQASPSSYAKASEDKRLCPASRVNGRRRPQWEKPRSRPLRRRLWNSRNRFRA